MYRPAVVHIVTVAVLGGVLLSSDLAEATSAPLHIDTSIRSLTSRIDTSDKARQYARSLFVRGMTSASLENYEEAISSFENALDFLPQEPAILLALADAHAQQDNYTSALFYARQAHQTNRSHPYYTRRLAELQQEAGHSRDAIETYRQLLARFPNDLDAHLALARLYKELEDPETALETYESLLERHERPSPSVYLEMLPLYRQVDNQERIEETLKTLIEFRVDDTFYRRLLGQLYTEQDRLGEAIELFESLLNERPEDVDLLSRLTLLYQQTGQAEEAQMLTTEIEASDSSSADHLVAKARSIYHNATSDSTAPEPGLIQSSIDLLQNALDQSPTSVNALDLLGTIYDERGRYADAARVLDRALDEDARSQDRWRRAAHAHLNADHPEKAAKVAEEGLLLFPGQYQLAQTAAVARLRLQDNESALDHFDTALDLLSENRSTDRQRARLHTGRGLALARLGRLQASDEAYEQALDLHSDQPAALNNYAYSLATRGERLDRALALAERAVERVPDNPSYLDTLGWVYFQRGNPEKAKTYLQKALDTDAAPAIVYQHYGDVQDALGNDASARTYRQQALDRASAPDTVQKTLDLEL